MGNSLVKDLTSCKLCRVCKVVSIYLNIEINVKIGIGSKIHPLCIFPCQGWYSPNRNSITVTVPPYQKVPPSPLLVTVTSLV